MRCYKQLRHHREWDEGKFQVTVLLAMQREVLRRMSYSIYVTRSLGQPPLNFWEDEEDGVWHCHDQN